MDILFFCARWGHAHLTWTDFARKVKLAGYDGIETDIPEHEKDREELLNSLQVNGLQLIAQHWETTEPDFETHLKLYAKRLSAMVSAKPLLINSQTGKDYYDFAQNKALIDMAESLAVETGIPIYHETHRGKFSFAAHTTAGYIGALPSLQLTLDISHWCVVAETLLDDQQEAVQKALARTRHIHARVGYPQSAQVTDPQLPEFEDAVQFHLSCWDKVVSQRRQEGHTMLTFTTEFGPHPYLVNNPETGKPIRDQWSLNLYMKGLLRKRYQ